MRYSVLAVWLLAGSAGATGLDDVKAALAPLQGLGTVRGAYEVRETRTNFESRTARGPETLLAVAQVSEDANSLDIVWDRSLLKKAADEASPSRGAQRKEGLSRLVASMSAPRIAAALNHAPRLLQSLSVGKLRLERADTYQGKPARLVEVAITPEEVPNDSASITDNTIVAQYWLGPDNVPLGAVTTHIIKAKFMVFMSYEKVTREEFSFAVAANRLVVLKRESRGKEKGPGTDNEFHNIYTFTPKL